MLSKKTKYSQDNIDIESATEEEIAAFLEKKKKELPTIYGNIDSKEYAKSVAKRYKKTEAN